MVVRRIPDTAEAKDDIAGRKAAPKCGSDARPVVANVLDPGQTKAPLREQLRHFLKMPIGALSRKNFIADDQCAKVHDVTYLVKPERFNASEPQTSQTSISILPMPG
jgi:hypothetical protein